MNTEWPTKTVQLTWKRLSEEQPKDHGMFWTARLYPQPDGSLVADFANTMSGISDRAIDRMNKEGLNPFHSSVDPKFTLWCEIPEPPFPESVLVVSPSYAE